MYRLLLCHYSQTERINAERERHNLAHTLVHTASWTLYVNECVYELRESFFVGSLTNLTKKCSESHKRSSSYTYDQQAVKWTIINWCIYTDPFNCVGIPDGSHSLCFSLSSVACSFVAQYSLMVAFVLIRFRSRNFANFQRNCFVVAHHTSVRTVNQWMQMNLYLSTLLLIGIFWAKIICHKLLSVSIWTKQMLFNSILLFVTKYIRTSTTSDYRISDCVSICEKHVSVFAERIREKEWRERLRGRIRERKIWIS